MKTRVFVAAIGMAIAIAACSSGNKDAQNTTQKKPMTERQRDSTIAHSKLPGAAVVGKALEQSDSAKARAERENAESQE